MRIDSVVRLVVACLLMGVLLAAPTVFAQQPPADPRPQPAQPAAEPGETRIKDLHFRDASLSDVLLQIGITYRVNIIFVRRKSDPITVTLDDVAVDRAIELIVNAAGLTCQRVRKPGDTSDTYIIETPVVAGPELQSEVFVIDPDVTLNPLAQQVSALRTGLGRIVINEQAQTIMVTDVPEAVLSMKRYIETITQQIKARKK